MTGEEHWEVASLTDAFEDWAAAPFRRKRRGQTKRLRFRATSIDLARCELCGARAEWRYIPMGGPDARCDDCVSRGCSCRIIADDSHIEGRTIIESGPSGHELVWAVYGGEVPREELDSFGRKLPCIEWEFYAGGFPHLRGELDNVTPATQKSQAVVHAAGSTAFQASFDDPGMMDTPESEGEA